ncbi:disulfide bond formation protein B [Chenggangzhangella methanolivorans]|uniref:Disulfide bond formation protein B n=2 Tax=Chenggangzhangella methanolivorans TaxID=1437009 RepID=A0A9E6UJU6_9HYPH|nr:disulfide bond formation protein B [Chenggangzhangella methanolivorans]
MTTRLTPAATALVVAIVSAATVGGALVMQHGFGYVPCMLCLWGRWPHYLGAPLALAAWLLATRGAPAPARIALALAALLFLAGAGLSAYHAGVEWGFWPGPASCAGANAAPTAAGGLLDQMRATRIVPCDAAAFRILGISLAGWNALICLALSAIAALGARRPGAAQGGA